MLTIARILANVWSTSSSALKVVMEAGTALIGSVNSLAAANQATGQVATSTAAATFVVARPTRESVLLRNLDTTISVYVGVATVTSANGMLLKAGESIEVKTTALIQVIAASGTPTVAYYDTYF